MPLPYIFRKLFTNNGAGDKLNTSLIPNTVVQTTAQSFTTNEQAQARTNLGVTQANLGGPFLPLAGGTITGQVTFKYSGMLTFGADETGRMQTTAVGKNNYTGMYLYVKSADDAHLSRIIIRHPDSIKESGRITLDSRDTLGHQTVLSLHPTGELYLGSELLSSRVYIAKSYHSGYTWARKWSDGFIEQGGRVKDHTKVTFTYAFSSAASWIGVCSALSTANEGNAVVNDSTRSATGCCFIFNDTSNYGYYYVSGY